MYMGVTGGLFKIYDGLSPQYCSSVLAVSSVRLKNLVLELIHL